MIHLEFDDDAARFHWVREFTMPWNIISFNISSAILKSSDALTRLGHDVNSKFTTLFILKVSWT